ncbi:MAG: CPBP family glutamic-type intramembrane protease [Candidatus Palauibacterales bacterium]|nr:CPBP family glutamic-type intramembrane protease [Candidatus Palauibacterales bacterium]
MREASAKRSAAIQAIINRPLIEPLIFVALALVFIWIVRPAQNDWLEIPLLTVIVAIPFASVWLHGDSLRELGLRFDNFWASARDVGAITLIGAGFVLAIGMLVGSAPSLETVTLRRFLLYPFWGLAQQFAMQSFTYRRVREGLKAPIPAAALTAMLFALPHLPNWSLASVTLLGGYVWCRLFERNPNLFTLALSHGWLAVLLRATWPAVWLHNLRIGPGYWSWTP